MSFGILYESTLAKGPEMVVEAMPPVAAEYERVHFIGHALWNPLIKVEDLRPRAEEIEEEIEQRTGYRVFLVRIDVKHFPPFITDVDYVMDVPVESPIAHLLAIIIITALAALFAIIVFIYWTYYDEEHRLFYCDQCPEEGPWEGKALYGIHLAEKHPKKYEAWKNAGETAWWTEIPEAVKWIVGGVIVATVGTVVVALIRRRRE